ncbi:hypothetical protein KSP39_PZI010304 [Platanthera zijinensis]|uniref:Putative plant transposon protein domain-containing protein n=1 Tax=Platanthera zijinensis TaxID=2320716 RepID=A0AAP0G6S9_9ASPA
MSSKRGDKRRKGKEVARSTEKFVGEGARLHFEQIKALHWESFCHPRTEILPAWVYEFYANARNVEYETVLVRGREVNFSAARISDIFNRGNQEYDDSTVILNKVTIDDILKVVCATSAPEWMSKKPTIVKTSCLTRQAKAWLLFVNVGVMLTKHPNSVALDKLALI